MKLNHVARLKTNIATQPPFTSRTQTRTMRAMAEWPKCHILVILLSIWLKCQIYSHVATSPSVTEQLRSCFPFWRLVFFLTVKYSLCHSLSLSTSAWRSCETCVPFSKFETPLQFEHKFNGAEEMLVTLWVRLMSPWDSSSSEVVFSQRCIGTILALMIQGCE